MSGAWRLSPHFLLRGTGFPIELLAQLAFVDSAAAVDDVLNSEAALAARARRLEELLTADRSPDRRKWWKHVHTGRSVGAVEAPPVLRAALADWDTAVAGHQDLIRATWDVFAAELPKRRADLRDIVADPRFGEAVWLSSPQMYEHGVSAYLQGRGGASAVRRVERQLVAYLQRFCAKNDTAAFFGPIDYGGVGAAVPAPRPDRGGPGTVRRREAFIAAWAVAALAGAVAADPAVRPHLRPVRGGLHRFDPDRGVVELPGRAARTLGARDVSVLAEVDGQHTVRDIAARCGLPVDEVLTLLDRLAAAKVVRLTPAASVLDAHPVRWLRGWLRDLPPECAARATWLAEVDAFVAVDSALADQELAVKRRLLAGLEERFTRLTGAAARRGGGAFYADRLLVYEEAAGDAGPLRLDPEAGERLRDRLAPVLEFFAGQACAVQDRLRAVGAARLAADGSLSLLSWVAALRETSLVESPGGLDLVRGREEEHEVELDLAALPVPDPAVLDREVLLSSPDVMLLATSEDDVRSGRGDLVIGECHDTALVWGWALRYHPDPESVERDVADLLRRAAGDRVLANVLPSRRIKIIPFEYPGPTIELAASSTKAAGQRVPAADVTVELRDGRPVLTAPGIGRFALYNGELHTPAHRIVALPRVVPPAGLETGAHTPRLRVGPVVIQRERWRVAPSDLFPGTYQGESVDLLLDYRRTARRLGLPRFVFARVAGETKPVCVDGHSWFMLAMLHHLIRDAEEVVLTEMLPAPDQLWLSGRHGRHCVELRLTMFRCPDSAGDPDAAGDTGAAPSAGAEALGGAA